MDRRLATPAAHGAYGLRVEGLAGAEEFLMPVDGGWPLLSVRWVEDQSEPSPEEVAAATSTISFGKDVAVVYHGAVGTIEVRREPAVATFRIRKVRDPRALVHPYLGGAASIVGRWRRWEAFHAGAFAGPSGAWVVLGDRAAGKSSLLAWLHSQGVGILADDVVVVTGRRALAAPRSLDLRRESAGRLQLGARLGLVGARERWRVRLRPVPLELPVAGFVFLSWGERVEVEPVTGKERLVRLSEGLTMPGKPADAAALIELATLPCLELRRPCDWQALETAGAVLLGATGG